MTKKLLYGLVAILLSYEVFAQEQKQTLTRADEYYSRYEYTPAALLYEKLAARKNCPLALWEKLAACYRKTNQYASAAKWYERITQAPQAGVVNLLYYGDMLKSTGRYTEAKVAYKQYQQTGESIRSCAERIAGCDSAIAWILQPTQHAIENLRALNTKDADWGADWYGNDSLVFTSDYLRWHALNEQTKVNKRDFGWTNQPYQKMYVADTTTRRGLGLIRDFSSVVNQYLYHIGPMTFSPGYDTAYITVTNPGRLPYKREKPLEVYGSRRLELYVSVKKKGRWQRPQSFIYNKPDAYSIGHAAISKDGSILYFASDMPGGQGGTDLWYCIKMGDSTWSTPVNCGTVINTAEEEEFPTITGDDLLVFSSKGHAGMGGFDLFSAQGSKDQWHLPVNLRYPLNSPGDDFYYVSRDHYSGFLSSNRPGGIGSDDIYRFTLARSLRPSTLPDRIIIVLETTVLDRQTHQPINGAAVALHNTQREDTWRQLTLTNGKTYNILEQQQHYALTAGKTGYDTASDTFNTNIVTKSDTMRVTLYISQATLQPGTSFVLQNLYYDLDKSTIRPDAARVLDSLATVLAQHPAVRIELSSHTDSRASYTYNMQLSARRAQAAVAYLVKKGIAPGRLVARGYGETRLVNKCAKGVKCTEAEHQANRRTEVKILEQE